MKLTSSSQQQAWTARPFFTHALAFLVLAKPDAETKRLSAVSDHLGLKKT